jgi:hypothetical protein
VSAPDITSLAQLKSAPNCRIVTATIGSAAYYQALIFQRELGLVNKCSIVQLPTTALEVQGTLSGAYQAAVVAYASSIIMAPQGGHVLIDPLSPAYAKTYGRVAYQAGLTWGLKDAVQAKSAAIVDYIKGSLDGADYVWTHTDKQVAEVIAKDPMFTGITLDQLTQQVAAVRPFIGISTDPTEPNYMTSSDWKRALTAFGQFGFSGYDPTSPLVQYSQVIDMTYYDKAFPKPAFVVDSTLNTLSKIAAAKLGSASKWKDLYAANKVWIDALGLKASVIPTARLRVGTVIEQ